ncbi:MAG: aldo/keto reductase [Rubrivivax sp.]
MSSHADVLLPDGEPWPALGLGTWRYGEQRSRQAQEVAAVHMALDIGYRLFDTAEMYGEGGAETVLGLALHEALRSGAVAREQLFIVSKVYPHNASAAGVAAACERSRRRLQLAHIDLYLLHWRGDHPLAETVRGFEALQQRGHIRHWGVSNFDVADIAELDAVPGGQHCATNQVYYSLSERGAETALLPLQQSRQMPLMAYSPIDQGGLAGAKLLQAVAQRHGATVAQVALAWVLSRPGVMAVPKSSSEPHLRANWAAAELPLTAADLAEIDALFPPPRRKTPLAMR